MISKEFKSIKVVERNEDLLHLFAERIDQLISLDVASRNVIHMLYEFARKKHESPLAMKAAKKLKDSVKPGDYVLIATGWPDRPHVSPEIAESDGPPGAVALARALHIGFGAIPIILIEEHLVKPMEKVLEATGIRAITPKEAYDAYHYHAAIHAGAVIGFPTQKQLSEEKAEQLLLELEPAAVISVEKGGMNGKGEIHTSRGAETTHWMAKIDYLIDQSNSKEILTIGIGDGGNEIGMGNIATDIKQHIPYGKTCKCGCEGGIAPVNTTDVLVAASISNWGAYGIAACLAALCGELNVLHDAEMEKRILEKSADARFIDGITGYVAPSADGLDWKNHVAFITLLRETVRQALNSKIY